MLGFKKLYHLPLSKTLLLASPVSFTNHKKFLEVINQISGGIRTAPETRTTVGRRRSALRTGNSQAR